MISYQQFGKELMRMDELAAMDIINDIETEHDLLKIMTFEY